MGNFAESKKMPFEFYLVCDEVLRLVFIVPEGEVKCVSKKYPLHPLFICFLWMDTCLDKQVIEGEFG